MDLLSLIVLLHLAVVLALLAVRAVHARLSSLPAATLDGTGSRLDLARPLSGHLVPSGRQLEEYVQAGLDDLRIMLVQAARRRRD